MQLRDIERKKNQEKEKAAAAAAIAKNNNSKSQLEENKTEMSENFEESKKGGSMELSPPFSLSSIAAGTASKTKSPLLPSGSTLINSNKNESNSSKDRSLHKQQSAPAHSGPQNNDKRIGNQVSLRGQNSNTGDKPVLKKEGMSPGSQKNKKDGEQAKEDNNDDQLSEDSKFDNKLDEMENELFPPMRLQVARSEQVTATEMLVTQKDAERDVGRENESTGIVNSAGAKK